MRDTLAFTMLPEEPKTLAAVYVNDMGRAQWEQPEPDTWIDATTAWFVVDSIRRGGMGAPEAVPFLDKLRAERFAAEKGGRVVTLEDIPREYVLGSSATEDTAGAGHENSAGSSHNNH